VEITTINTELVAKMFLAGAKNLDAKKEWINELNVFPVPDGDTGTNMSMTIMSAAREVSALEKPEMKALAKAISSGSLRGARGNSGVILSQLFRGFTKVIAEYDEINVQILSDSFQKAVETAYKAVMKPPPSPRRPSRKKSPPTKRSPLTRKSPSTRLPLTPPSTPSP
jgi:dihydroxyacetone kinase-like predicted kinase